MISTLEAGLQKQACAFWILSHILQCFVNGFVLPSGGGWTLRPESAMVVNLEGFEWLAQIRTVLFSLQDALSFSRYSLDVNSMTRSYRLRQPSVNVIKCETRISGNNLNAHLAPPSPKDGKGSLLDWSWCFTGSLLRALKEAVALEPCVQGWKGCLSFMMTQSSIKGDV